VSSALRVVVTGASRGIGLALARHLISDGHDVVGAVRDPSAAVELATLGAAIVELDVSSPRSLASFTDAVSEHLELVDVIVNNAGIKQVPGYDWDASAGPLSSINHEAVLALLATNVIGPLAVTQALLPVLRRPGAVVLNVSSQLGSLSAGIGVDYAYNASKAALNMVTVTMARDLGHGGIVPVALNPGWIKTDMTAGDDAPLDVEQATREIGDLIPRLGPQHAGQFLDRFGSPVPW